MFLQQMDICYEPMNEGQQYDLDNFPLLKRKEKLLLIITVDQYLCFMKGAVDTNRPFQFPLT